MTWWRINVALRHNCSPSHAKSAAHVDNFFGVRFHIRDEEGEEKSTGKRRKMERRGGMRREKERREENKDEVMGERRSKPTQKHTGGDTTHSLHHHCHFLSTYAQGRVINAAEGDALPALMFQNTTSN